MSVYLSILKQWIIDPIQDSIVVPISNPSTQTLLLLPLVLPILNHFTTNPIKTLLLLLIILPILNQWITVPLQNYIFLPILNQLTSDRLQIVPISDLLTTDRIKKFLFLPIIAIIGKKIKDHLLKCVSDHLRLHILYPFKCDSYVETLEKQTKQLKEKRDSLEQSAVETEDVIIWLSSANSKINEAEALIQHKEEAKMMKCLFWLYPNLKSRYQLSKEADKKASAIHKLQNQEGLVQLSYCPPPQQTVASPVYSLEALPSRVSLLNEVMAALKDPNLYMIGVYDLEFVGKTTLANEVQRQAVAKKMFKRVVLVHVSQTPDPRKIQKDIADFVGLKFDAQGSAGRATQLIERLKISKVLIILDGICTKFELAAVGIPLKDECKRSKFLLTSRSQDVLSQMGTQKEFLLEVLGEEEKWKLFQKTMGNANNPELQAIAIEVSKECSGLPFLVNKVAAELKNKELSEWTRAQMNLSNLKNEEIHRKVSKISAATIDKRRNQEGLVPLSSRPPLQQIVEPFVYSVEALPSRWLILNQVMDALKDPNLYMIGVYGLGGVGKTTLATEVRRKAAEEKMFEAVVMVLVSQTPDLRKIQEEIADFVDLKFDAQRVTGRASELKERLKKSKVLIILDDIWTKLELNDVGIPLGDECKGIKLLLTSRSHDVLSRQMGTQKEFSLEVLGEEETWKLFQKTLEDADKPELQDIAIVIAKKCSGLPLLVNIVAADLKEDLSAWRDILVKLSDFDNEEIHGKVHKVLESSFKNLPSNEAKSLFLLCSLFGQSNIPTNHLLTYAMGLGLFKNIVRVEQARDRLYLTIARLKAESLLLDGDMNGHVKLHDVVQDFARSIATKKQHAFFGITGNGLMQLWPDDENCTRIVLHHCDISELPEGLEYPNTELLSIVTEDLNLVVPDLFFKGIRKLRVLNLTGMCLMPLPSSLQSLTNLHSLYMHQCCLRDVAIIGNLKQLKFLSFEKSDIVKLPTQLGELTQLRSLNLNYCSKLKIIPPNVLPKLSLLEELYMYRSFDKWDENGNASLMELEELRQLTTLEVGIFGPKKLPNQLFLKGGLERYRISIGKWKDDWWTYEVSRALRLELETNIHFQDGLLKLLRGSEDLSLAELKGMKNGLYDLNEEGFPKLKHLYIQDNKAIRHIIDSTMWVSCDAFPILESLELFGLNSLEEICHGGLGTESFRKLQTLNIVGCNKLKKLFSFSTAKMISLPNLTILEVEECKSLKYIFKTSTVKSLLQLKRLKIKDCELMEEIILTEEFEAEEKTDEIVFSKLEFLELSELPNLIRFSNGYPIEFQSLIEMKISCPALKNFISDNSNWSTYNVESLFNEMISFPNLTILEVEKCKSLKYIFKTPTVKSLLQLRRLKVKDCELMKVIVLTEEFEAEEKTDGIVFSKLECLALIGLPNLNRFSNGYPIEFQSLIEMKISSCPALKNFISNNSNWGTDNVESLFNEMAIFPNLQTMDVSYMDNLKYIWRGQFADDSFCKLKSLRIKRCPDLKAVFATSTNVMRGFQILVVELWDCDKYIGVFS